MSNGTLRRVTAKLLPALLLLSGSACDRDRASDRLIGANTFLIDEQITSEKYAKWVEAQQNLDRTATDADMVSAQDRLGIRRATRGAVDSAIARLEQNERTRQAIESAGLSVRDYVITSLALSQAFVASNPEGQATVSGIPSGNLDLIKANRGDFERHRSAARFRVVDDRDSDSDRRDADTDTDRKKKKKG